MNDEHDNPGAVSLEGEPQGPRAGERLAEARRAQQIPVLEIAKELHLDEYKVRALEENDFDVIGAAVFAKGHLRKYAQLVQVAEADVMADYYQLTRSAGAPPVVSLRPRRRRNISSGAWLSIISLLVLAALAYWLFDKVDETPARQPDGDIAPMPVDDGGILQQEEADAPVEDVQIADPEPAPELAVEEPAVDAVKTPAASEFRLTVRFSGDSWTEITDAEGKRLFFGLGTDGRIVNLSGEAPFNVLFGNAEYVSLEINGAPFDIPASSRRGRTARMTIPES